VVYKGADAFKLLCKTACNYCESNLRFISGNRPDLLKDLSDLISDTYDLTPATAASDPNSLFTFAPMDLVQPLANYAYTRCLTVHHTPHYSQ